MKQWSYHRYVIKVHTGLLKEHGWKLSVGWEEARKSGLLVELAESACIRMIEEIANVNTAAVSQRLGEIRAELRDLGKLGRSREVTEAVAKLFAEKLSLQLLPEYVCLVCGNAEEFRRARKGFEINGRRYFRLAGTSNGLKRMTVVFVSEYARNGAPLLDELRRRIDNGRDRGKEFIPAKLEAYRALVCSATAPLSGPSGVLVVKDCVTRFRADYIHLSDSLTGEPEYSEIRNGEMELDASDGYGLMSPELAERWGRELGLSYRPAGLCIRNSFCKGMVFAFDFHEFGRDIAGNCMVRDAWGTERDIRDVELVITTSMLKLWDSYPSMENYLEHCWLNGYVFSAAKVTPRELDHERYMNYQFLQTYRLGDDELWELVSPALREIEGAMGGDYDRTLLFLRGTGVDENSAVPEHPDWVTALSANPALLSDPFIRRKIKNLIQKKIRGTKIGEIKVHGNFSAASGDPYALCQSMFGLKVTGLLKAGEIYNKYWADRKTGEVACFRAPMSCHNNIRKAKVTDNWLTSHWYQYMDTVTVLNAWDCTCAALNGMDFDGDLIFLTDHPVLVRNVRDTLPIVCEQRSGVKLVPDEAALAEGNVLGFGDDIGKITNRVTAQTELLSMFPPESGEYRTLEYRICCGQHYQQLAIDKIKGVVASPMPRSWYNRKAAGCGLEGIVADRKPYFMIYRYDGEYKRYRNYQRKVRAKALMLFGCPLEDLEKKDHPTEAERRFLEEAEARCPVFRTGGLMNRLCRMSEDFFREKKNSFAGDAPFDPSILKSGSGYSRDAFEKVREVYGEYLSKRDREERRYRLWGLSEEEISRDRNALADIFRESCLKICPNPLELADILVDLCYRKEGSKQFAWQMCGETIAGNVIRNSGGKVRYLKKIKPGAERGESIFYNGNWFRVCFAEWEGYICEDDYSGRSGDWGADTEPGTCLGESV